MALRDQVAALTRRLSIKVFINRVLLSPGSPAVASGIPGISAIKVSKSFESPNPVARVTVNRVSSWIQAGMELKIELGYDGVVVPVFTGTVASKEPKSPGSSQIVGTGQITNVFRKSEIAERDVDTVTVKNAIISLLNDAGIWNVRFLNIPSYTIGSSADITANLERGTVSQMLDLLMMIDGLRLTERGTGQVRIEPTDLIPAPKPFRVYSSQNDADPHIISGGTQEDPGAIKTKIIVRGATVVSGTPPNQTSDTLQGIATLGDTSAVRPKLADRQFIEAEFSNPLVDTVTKLEEIASRIQTELGRVPRTIRLQIPGDPELDLGFTLRMDFPAIDVVGDFIIASIDHQVSEGLGFITTLGLIGGVGSGVSVLIPPIADFTHRVVTHVQGSQIFAEATFDASPSHDPDGEIVKYEWSDNKVTTPEIAAVDEIRRTVLIDPGIVSDDWDVTLTVTDNDGLITVSDTQRIDVPLTSTEVEIPAIYVATNGQFWVSPDGGQNWTDVIFSGGFTAVAARPPSGEVSGWAVVGLNDGRIWRTLDFAQDNLTQALGPSGTQIEDIQWDWRNQADIWAINTIGKVYRSQNLGFSFELYADLRSVFSATDPNLTTYHIGLPAPGGIWIYGGSGGGSPLIAVNPDTSRQAWRKVAMSRGDLSSDLPGPAGLHIVDAQDTGGGGGLVIALATAGSNVYGLYHIADPNIASNGWTRPQGISSSLTEGRFVVGEFGVRNQTPIFHAGFNNRDVYHSINGVNWEKTANVLPVGSTPNHVIWLLDELFAVDLPSVHIIAASNTDTDEGLYMSSDGMESVTSIRPATGFSTWPAGRTAAHVAIGPSPGGSSSMVMVSEQPSDSSRWVSRKLFNPNWDHEDIPTALASSDFNRMRVITNQVWFVFGFDAITDYASVVPLRTADGGETFAAMANPTGNYKFVDVTKDASGQFWGLAIDTVTPANIKIYSSTIANAGADGTWVESYSASHGTHGLCTIFAHPLRQDRIYVAGHKDTNDMQTLFTIDRGANWTNNIDTGITMSTDLGVQAGFVCLSGAGANNRLVGIFADLVTGRDQMNTTDDSGIKWFGRKRPSTLAADFMLGPVGTLVGDALYFVVYISHLGIARIYESTDGGQTWNNFDTYPDNRSGETPAGGIAFDEAERALYIKFSGGSTEESKYIFRSSPVHTDGIWQDFTSDIFPTGVSSLATTGQCQSMDIIPL